MFNGPLTGLSRGWKDRRQMACILSIGSAGPEE